MAVEEVGDLLAAATQAVVQQGRQAGPDSKFVVDASAFGAQRGDVVSGECHVGALQRPAVTQTGAGGATAVAVLLAQRLVRLKHTGGERAGINSGFGSAHEPDKPAVVGQDDAGEAGLLAELIEPAHRLGGGWSGEMGVFVGVDHGQEVFAASEGLFGFDLGSEAGVGGSKW